MYTRTVALVLLSLAACGPAAGHGSGGGEGGDASGGSQGASSDGATGGDDWPGIVDQSGGKFLWNCDDQEECQIERVEGISPRLRECEEPTDTAGMDGAVGLYVPVINRFFGVLAVCDADGFQFYQDHDERYLVCDTEDDCVQPIGGPVYACHARFCQDVDLIGDLLTRREMLKICYGDEPRFDHGAAKLEYQAAVEEACPGESQYSTCESIPAGCRDPT